jgi:hypothetical protein
VPLLPAPPNKSQTQSPTKIPSREAYQPDLYKPNAYKLKIHQSNADQSKSYKPKIYKPSDTHYQGFMNYMSTKAKPIGTVIRISGKELKQMLAYVRRSLREDRLGETEDLKQGGYVRDSLREDTNMLGETENINKGKMDVRRPRSLRKTENKGKMHTRDSLGEISWDRRTQTYVKETGE